MPLSRPDILICTAMPMEANAIARRLKLGRSGRDAWETGAVRLVNLGLRASRLVRGEVDLFGDPPGVVMMAGLAGALDPSLQIGSIVIDGSPEVLADLGQDLTPGAASRIHTAEHMVSTAKEKRALFAATGCAAVDMESAILRDATAARGVGFVAVRAISDRAADNLDKALLNLLDADGRPRGSSIAAALACRPWLVLEMLRMGRKARTACTRLAETVEALVKHWQEAKARTEART